MFKFPFTNYQELNLDWIVKQVKNLLEVTKHDLEVVEQYENRLVLAEQAAQTAEENSLSAINRADAASSNANAALTQTVINTNDITTLQTDANITNNKIGDLSQLQTPHKNNLVSAINDAAASGGGGGGGAVSSVNGQTGAVVLDAEDVGALPDTYTAPVTSVNGQTGAVTVDELPAVSSEDNGKVLTVVSGDWAAASGGGGGAVSSVNGQTGAVVLDAEDVGALPDTYTAPVTSVNGKTGAVQLYYVTEIHPDTMVWEYFYVPGGQGYYDAWTSVFINDFENMNFHRLQTFLSIDLINYSRLKAAYPDCSAIITDADRFIDEHNNLTLGCRIYTNNTSLSPDAVTSSFTWNVLILGW